MEVVILAVVAVATWGEELNCIFTILPKANSP